MKFRLSSAGVNDVGGMSLHSMSPLLPDFYIVCLGNSNLMSRYSETFINFTVNFQINDARILPIIIPNEDELTAFKKVFDKALSMKKLHTEKQDENNVNKELNRLVDNLYISKTI